MNRYYDNCFHTEHNANVLEVMQEGNLYWHRLDETIFYVEGGGMASDVGKINGLDVINLKKVNGEVWHLLEEKLEGPVSLSVNLFERFRKTQIHTTQHLISALCAVFITVKK